MPIPTNLGTYITNPIKFPTNLSGSCLFSYYAIVVVPLSVVMAVQLAIMIIHWAIVEVVQKDVQLVVILVHLHVVLVHLHIIEVVQKIVQLAAILVHLPAIVVVQKAVVLIVYLAEILLVGKNVFGNLLNPSLN